MIVQKKEKDIKGMERMFDRSSKKLQLGYRRSWVDRITRIKLKERFVFRNVLHLYSSSLL
jgi:hypothetical protein